MDNDAIHRESQTIIGWTREYCWYLDFLATIDISFCATWKQRSRYENRLLLGVNDGPHPGPVRERDDFLKTTRRIAALQREEGRVNVYIPKEESAKDHSLKHCEQTLSGTATTGDSTGRSKMARTTPRRMTRLTWVGRVMAADSFKPCLHRFRVLTLANVVHATGGEEHLVECTERDTDAHFSCISHM